MKAVIYGVLCFVLGSTAMAKAFDCSSDDKKLTVLIRAKGASVEGGIPSTVEIRGLGEPQIYSNCEQRYTQMHDQDIIGITCDLENSNSSVGLGIFLPELDGFIETAEQEVIDLQCLIVDAK